MAIGSILLSPGSAVLPDGSAGNLAPALLRFQGTETNPKKHLLCLSYDGAGTKELAWWTFRMPADYSSAPILKILWMANATTATSVVWSVQLGAVTAGDVDTPLEHASAAASSVTTAINTTEARRLNSSSITLANLDGLAAADLMCLTIWRDSADASDTCLVDAELVAATLEYTSA
jgi:hypothetical protein